MPNAAIEQSTLPDVKKGDSLPVGNSSIEEKMTGPPDYLSEADLITLMEKHGIGTDASIPVHINNIVQRNYVQLGAYFLTREIPSNRILRSNTVKIGKNPSNRQLKD